MRLAGRAMKKLSHIIVAVFLVVVMPVSYGKPINSETQNIGNGQVDSKKEMDNSISESTGHNNLLSDLARISKDEEANVANPATAIVGTEASAATIKNSNKSLESNNNDQDSMTRTMVTSSPTETESPASSYLASPSPTSGTTETPSTTAKADNDMSLVRLSEPTHIVLGKSKNEDNSFSKLITSNENAPEEEKSNDAVNKQQELSPLISGRTEEPQDESNDNKETSLSSSVTSDSTVPAVDEFKDMDNSKINNEQTLEGDTSSTKIQNDGVKSAEVSPSVDKGVKDIASDHVVVCAGEKQTISCPDDATLNITTADYGYDMNSGCPIENNLPSPSCQADGVYPVVKSACQGQASCLLQSDGQEFGGMCPGQNNFLKVGYSCENGAPLLSSSSPSTSVQSSSVQSSPVQSTSTLLDDSQQPPASSYETSPYIPHPVQSTQPSSYYYNAYNQPSTNNYNNYAYNQPKLNTYNSGLMYDNYPGKPNNPYSGYYGNQGYYNYYNQGHRVQTTGNQARPSQSAYYAYKPRLPARSQEKRPPRPAIRRPQPPRNNYGSPLRAQYQDSNNRYSQRNYNTYYNGRNNYENNRNNYYNTRKGYYDTRYYDQPYSQYRQQNNRPQYPRNSYLGSCYACQNCQQCSEQAYCQGCPKCKVLQCNKKRPKEEKYLDPIDSLVEEFGKKTKGMTPMEMSAIVISPAPKIPAIAHSLPLAPPPKPLEEDDDDDDDDDNDSDENEFTLFENESNNHEIADNESPLSQKKTSVSSTKSSVHSRQQKDFKNKEEKGERRNKIYHTVRKVNEIYDDDDDEDGYDFKVYQNLLKKPKRNKIHHHKNTHHSKRRKSKRRLRKRWYNENENVSEYNEESDNDLGENEDRSIEAPYYYDGAMIW